MSTMNRQFVSGKRVPAPQPTHDQRKRLALVSITLAICIAVVFGNVCGHEFLNYDDQMYVTDNTKVREGLTGSGLWWALTAKYASNWHPLTWLSLQLDAQLFGMQPWGFHLTNLLLHIANTVLLFLVLARMTGALGRSAIVAALFGLHPLHVESVAWVTERKDVLSTFFWILTMGTYQRYTENPHWRNYLVVIAAFGLGALAKPMVVTLPFVLLLLDYWPLQRLGRLSDDRGWRKPDWVSLRSRLLEKIPLFVLSAASSVATWIAQDKAKRSLESLPLDIRLGNALLAYCGYLRKTFWPVDLAA